jgi:hypothetical protein
MARTATHLECEEADPLIEDRLFRLEGRFAVAS